MTENRKRIVVQSSNLTNIEGSTAVITVPIGSGTMYHSELNELTNPNQHPISAISGLQIALDSKANDAAGSVMEGPTDPNGPDNQIATKGYVDNSPGSREVYAQNTNPGSGLYPIFWADTTNPYVPGSGGSGVGGLGRSVFVINSSTTAGEAFNTEYVYICTDALTLTLPTAVDNTNTYLVKRVGTSDVIVDTTDGQTIDDIATHTLDVRYQAVNFVSDGTNWVVF